MRFYYNYLFMYVGTLSFELKTLYGSWTFRKAMSENLLKGGKPLCFHDNSVIGVGK